MGYHRWLVELEVKGQISRLSLDDEEVTDEDGNTILYRRGLAEEPQAAEGEESISLSLRVDGVDADQLPDAVVRLYHLAEGDVLEERREIISGKVSGLSWDLPSTIVEMDITRPDEMESPPFLDPQARVDDLTFPVTGSAAAVTSQQGIAYPLIFGFPGYFHDLGEVARCFAVVPVPIAEYIGTVLADCHVVISDRELLSGTGGDTVLLLNTGLESWDQDDEGWATLVDGAGRTVVAADFASGTTDPGAAKVESSKFYAGFSPDRGGGKWRTAYEVVDGLLREYSGDYTDWSRMPEVESLLERFLVDSWVTAPNLAASKGRPPVWGWIESVLVPYLPVVVRRSGRGLYLGWDRWWADASDAQGELDVDLGDCDPRGPVSWSSAEVVNEVTALYQPGLSGWAGQRTYTSQDEQIVYAWTGTTDIRVLGHPLAAQSQARFGVRRSRDLEVAWCWDTETLLHVLHYQLEQYAIPPDIATYWVRDGHRLHAGDVRLLTHADRGWSQRVAIVADEPVLTSTGGIVTFRIR